MTKWEYSALRHAIRYYRWRLQSDGYENWLAWSDFREAAIRRCPAAHTFPNTVVGRSALYTQFPRWQKRRQQLQQSRV